MATITACLIVKNEAANLADCLQSIQGFVDQIVIVDTGSTDETLTIAASFTDFVFEQPWNDDFSAPRNFALEQATGDWVLHVDADERWTPEGVRLLLEHLYHWSPLEPVLVHCYYQTAQELLLKRTLHSRAFFKFKGCVHEYLDSEGPIHRFDLPQVVIQHYPNLEHKIQKQRVYALLIQKSLRTEQPDAGRSAELYWHLYQSHQTLEKNAQPALDKAFTYLRLKGLERTQFDYVLLMTYARNLKKPSQLLSLKNFLERACEVFDSAACWYLLAQAHVYSPSGSRAKKELGICLAHLQRTYDSTLEFAPTLADLELLWSRYSVQQRDFDKALFHAKQACLFHEGPLTKAYWVFTLLLCAQYQALYDWLKIQGVHTAAYAQTLEGLQQSQVFNSEEQKMLRKSIKYLTN